MTHKYLPIEQYNLFFTTAVDSESEIVGGDDVRPGEVCNVDEMTFKDHFEVIGNDTI